MTVLACDLCGTEFKAFVPQVAKGSYRRHRVVCVRATPEERAHYKLHRLWPRGRATGRPKTPPPPYRYGRAGAQLPVFRG